MDRIGKLRVVYGLALAVLVILAAWMVLFDISGMLGAAGFSAGAPVSSMLSAFGLLCVLIVGAPLGFLLWKPMGWGKLLMPVYGFAWIMHGAIIALMGSVVTPPLHVVAWWVPIACGAAMFALAIAHQVIDPSFFRSRPA